MCKKMAAELGGRVCLNSAVVKIEQNEENALIEDMQGKRYQVRNILDSFVHWKCSLHLFTLIYMCPCFYVSICMCNFVILKTSRGLT